MFDLPAASVTGPDTVAKARVIWHNGFLNAYDKTGSLIFRSETSRPKGRFVIGPWTTEQGHTIRRKCYACSTGFRKLSFRSAESLLESIGVDVDGQ